MRFRKSSSTRLILIVIIGSMLLASATHSAFANTEIGEKPLYPYLQTNGGCFSYGTSGSGECSSVSQDSTGVYGLGYAASHGTDGTFNGGFVTDPSPCYSQIGTSCTPDAHTPTITGDKCCTVFADIDFLGEMAGSGATSTGYGSSAIFLLLHIYHVEQTGTYCTVVNGCVPIMSWVYKTDFRTGCYLQADSIIGPVCGGTPTAGPIVYHMYGRAILTGSPPSGATSSDIYGVTAEAYVGAFTGTAGACSGGNCPTSGAYAISDYYDYPYYVNLYDFGFIQASPPNAPTLISPANNAAASSPVTFQWNPAPDAAIISSYDLQEGTDPSFSTNTQTYSISSSATSKTLTLSEGRYYWRVRENTRNPSETGQWSGSLSFIVDNTPPSAPTLSSPANGALTNNNRPTLTWNPSTDGGNPPSGIAYYQAELDSSSSFNQNPIITCAPSPTCPNPVTGTSVQTPQIANDGTYYWRVLAVDKAGNVGPWSSTWSFTLDTTPPSAPALVSPSNSSTTVSNTPTLSWSSASDLNGIRSYTLQLDTSRTFDSGNRRIQSGITGNQYGVSSPLSNAVWYWRVQAVDNAGNVGPWSQTWSFTAPPPPDFSMYLANSNTFWVAQGSSNKVTLNIQSLNGFTGTVTLSTVVGPSGAGLTFNPGQVTLTSGGQSPSVLTVFANSNMAPGTYYFTVAGTGGGLTHDVQVNFQVTPSPITVSQTLTFGDVTATISGTFTVDTSLGTASGTAYISATNATSGVTLASNKPYAMSLTYGSNGQAEFLDEIAASPYWLGLGCTINIVSGSTTCTLTRTPDINHDGIVNIVDMATVSNSYGSTQGSSNYNPAADLNADGKIDIQDLAMVAYYYGQPTYLP